MSSHPYLCWITQSLHSLDQQDSGAGLLAQRDGVALHEFGAGTDFFAAVEVLDLVAMLLMPMTTDPSGERLLAVA